MSGSNINDLSQPPRARRIDRVTPPEGKQPFETIAKAASGNVTSGKSMLAAAKRRPPSKYRLRRVRLAESLIESGEQRQPLETLACKLFTRMFRLRLIGALWPFIANVLGFGVALVTIIPKGWEVPSGKLHKRDPQKMLKAFKTALYRCGAAKADGWLIVFIHGEYEPTRNVYQLHLHGFGVGGMLDVLRRLGEKPKYRGDRKRDKTRESHIKRRVQLKPVTDLPHVLGYIFQPFWPKRAIVTVCDPDGRERRVRQRGKGRIPEPQHSEILLWLDRYTPKDLGLMVGMRVCRGGFKATRPPVASKSTTYSNRKLKAALKRRLQHTILAGARNTKTYSNRKFKGASKPGGAMADA